MSTTQQQTDTSVTPASESEVVEVRARALPELKGSYVIELDGKSYVLDRQLLIDPEGHKQIPCGEDGQKIAYIKRCSGTFITKDGRGVRCHNNFFQLPKSYKSYCPLCNDPEHPERREFNESQKHTRTRTRTEAGTESDGHSRGRGRGNGRGRGLGRDAETSYEPRVALE